MTPARFITSLLPGFVSATRGAAGQGLFSPAGALPIYSHSHIFVYTNMKTVAANPVDAMFRAFADPTRLRILNLLLAGELCVCEIVNALRIPQPTASRHLAYLKKSGLVEARRDGLWIHYKLAPPQTAFHEKLLDCLACCVRDVPQLAKDAKQLKRCC